MPENSRILNDLNKVFIPCRTVLEMEALISIYLLNSNYDRIKDIPDSQLSAQRLIDILAVRDEQFYCDIIDYFINCAVPKVKSIVIYERNHHDRYRRGNVVAYSKTRVCVYLALHRLKLKFLIIKNIIDKFKDNNYNLEAFNDDNINDFTSFLAVFADEYYKRNKMSLKLMFPKSKVSERVRKLIDNKDAITSEKLLKIVTSNKSSIITNIIKFIMREVKASIFVCKLMFAKMDLYSPFSRTKEIMIDAEEIMLSNDFIPELIPAISKSLRDKNFNQLNDCISAFYFLMDIILEGINNAIEIASKGQIQLGLYDTIYNSGNALTYQL